MHPLTTLEQESGDTLAPLRSKAWLRELVKSIVANVERVKNGIAAQRNQSYGIHERLMYMDDVIAARH